ncbi:type II secretion system F family protein [Celerinatantimonas yamalensis]|uniref:Type II secretion system F family protein n=1 Tax=Celerinatantimonas yamalensis TaxID=559956 RepID=A0ABW9G1R1_9GAMM
MNIGTMVSVAILAGLALLLASLIILMLRAFSRERKLKNFIIKQQAEETWRDKILEFSQRFTSFNHESVSQDFIAAGIYNERYALFFFPLKYGGFILSALVIYLFRQNIGLSDSMHLMAIIATLAVVFIIAPDMYLRQRKQQLTRKISQNLPYLIDLLSVCVQTGMTIEAGFIYLTKEMASFDRDLAYALQKTTDRSKVVGLSKSLEELLVRVPSNEMRSFVHTINQSLQYGSSIYKVLLMLSKDIRELQMLTLEEKVGKLSAKMSIPLIVFIMLPVAILTAGPGVMRLFYHGF